MTEISTSIIFDSTQSTSYSNDQEDISLNGDINSDTYRRISACLAWLTLALCIFGLIGNAFSIVIYGDPSMRSPINILLMGTSYIDFTLSLLSVPTFVIPGMFAYYNTNTLQSIMAYSSAYIYPLTLMMQSASVWAFVIITIERYQAVCKPFKTRWSTIQRSKLAILAVCLLAVAYNAVRFFEFRLQYSVANDNETTYIDVVVVLRNDPYYMNIYYTGMFLVTHFAVPFLVLVILNAFIIRTICQSRQRRKQLNRKERSEHRTAIMMVIVVLTFIFCYTLLFILNILEAADPNWFYNSPHMALAYALNDISNVLIVFNAASSIVVYYFFSQKYRTLLLATLTKVSPRVCLKYAKVPKTDAEAMNEEEFGSRKSNRKQTPVSTSQLMTTEYKKQTFNSSGKRTSVKSNNFVTLEQTLNGKKISINQTTNTYLTATLDADVISKISDKEEN